MGCFEVMEMGFGRMHKGAGGGGGLWDFLYPPALEGGPQKLMSPWGCSTPTEQPVQPQFGLGVGPGFRGLRCPQPLGTARSRGQWHWGMGEKDFFSHLLGLLLLGAAWLLAGAVGHRKQRGEGFQPSTAPRGAKTLQQSTTPIFGGERSAFRLAPEAAPPVSTGSSSANAILPSREPGMGSAMAKVNSNEVNLGTPPSNERFSSL